MDRRNRTGVTLVECLIAVIVIAILAALIIPAIQKLRESAARTECTNHLKTIGQALGHYHDANKVFPAGFVSKVDAAGNDTGPGWGWASLILRHLEQEALTKSIAFDQAIEAPENAQSRTTILRGFRCPSDRPPATWTARRYDADGTPDLDICELAFGNYIGVFGVGEPGADGDGMFFRNSEVRIKDIADGVSNTLSVGERDSSLAMATWVGAVTKAKLFPASSASFVLGHTGGMISPAEPTEVNHFASRHPGGVNFAFADGHVQFLTGSMPANIFRALSTRSGNESVIGEK